MRFRPVPLHSSSANVLMHVPPRFRKAAPHSPRRQKLNLRMKSLSLDSPESTELHGQMRRRYPGGTVGVGPGAGGGPHNYHGGSGGQLEHSTPPSNNSRLHCKWTEREMGQCLLQEAREIITIVPLCIAAPSSPSQQQRRLLYANRGLRTGSVDLPDDVDKSPSSASTSPCPSPVRQNQVIISPLCVWLLSEDQRSRGRRLTALTTTRG